MSLDRDLQQCLNELVGKEEVAGINVLIRKDDKDLLYLQSGYADVGSKKELSRDSIFRIYSMSKPITSAAVMMLVQKGKIGLAEPVSKYLPGFKDQKIYDENGEKDVIRPVFIRDLMNMTAGLPYGDPLGCEVEKRVQEVFDEADRLLYTKDALTTGEMADRLGKAGVCFQPGTSWIYGTGADILGALIEVVSGKSFGEYLKDEIFDPLDMNDTGFYLEKDKQERLASAYERHDGSLDLFETNNLAIRYKGEGKPAFESGGAGLLSTVDDYARFGQMLLNGGEYKGRRLLHKKTVEYMTQNILTPCQQEGFVKIMENLPGYSYGSLMRKAVCPEMIMRMTFKGEYGWDGWLGTFFENIPTLNICLVIGMQLSDLEGNAVSEKIRNVVHPLL